MKISIILAQVKSAWWVIHIQWIWNDSVTANWMLLSCQHVEAAVLVWFAFICLHLKQCFEKFCKSADKSLWKLKTSVSIKMRSFFFFLQKAFHFASWCRDYSFVLQCSILAGVYRFSMISLSFHGYAKKKI